MNKKNSLKWRKTLVFVSALFSLSGFAQGLTHSIHSVDCKAAAIKEARTKSFFGKELLFAKKVYGPNETGDEVYLVKFQSKQNNSDGVDTDLISVCLQVDSELGCSIQNSAEMINHTP